MTAGPAGRRRALLAALVVAAGCTGGSSAGGAHGPGDAHGAAPLVSVDGGTVTVAVASVPTTLNPHTVAGSDAVTQAVGQLVWPQVFRVSAGATPVSAPAVDSAEVVNLSPQTVVYQIDPRAEWSDGTPVDAQDFVYAWLSQSGGARDIDGSPDSVASNYGYNDISSVVGSHGGKTVTVVFQRPFVDWESLFDNLLPAHVAERVGWNDGFSSFDPSALVSGGPWVVSAWTPGQRLTLARNSHWWGPAPRLDKVVLTVVSAADMAQALASGQVQVASAAVFDEGFEAAVSSSPTVESAMQLGTSMLQLVFNTRHAPLDDVLVRQGISHALDRAQLVTGLVQPLDPLVWEDNNHLFANVQAPYADDGGAYTQPDPATASRDLTVAGLVASATGAWSFHGVPVQLRLAWASDDPWSALVAPAIAAQLVGAGFEVASDPVPATTLQGSVLPAGSFDLALVPVRASAFPSRLGSVFGADSGSPTSAYANWSGYDDPRIDTLFAQASEQLGATQEAQSYRQVDDALWTSMPSLPLFAEPTATAWSASLTGVKAIPGPLGPLWSVESWARLVALAPKAVSASGLDGRPPHESENRSR